MRAVLRGILVSGCVLASVVACDEDEGSSFIEAPEKDSTCLGLYGSPNERTGLDEAVCFPAIEGDEIWEPRAWDDDGFAELLSWTLDEPIEVIADNPYAETPDLEPNPNAVCAVMPTGENTYRLETFEGADPREAIDAALDAGGIVTHGGACGACSSLADLEVYARVPDQTQPVRDCGIQNLGAPIEDVDQCIQDAVGFSPPCARIWAYNTVNDGEVCRDICLNSVLILMEPYNNEDGSLNSCLQCDEDFSGGVFKTIAGRTRRNSGLASAICRPCETVWRIEHNYE